MRAWNLALWRCSGGGAAAEMALITPLLMTLMFGPLELGNYFYSEHVVEKAVRDGARYASRRSFDDISCLAPIQDVIDKTRYVTRTGVATSGGPQRLAGWTSDTTVTVTSFCDTTGTYVNNGIYAGLTGGVRVVRVTASVPYTTIVGQLGLVRTDLTLNAQSEAAVMGI